MSYFVRAGSLWGFTELVLRYKQNPTRLMQSVGLANSILQDPDLYIPYNRMARLLENAAEQCKAPDFGLQLGLRQGLEVLGALGPALCLQKTVADTLTIIRKNLDFHARGVSLETRVENPWIDLSLRFAFQDEFPCTQLTALSMTLMIRSIEQLHGTGEKPALVRLAFKSPPGIGKYSSGFGCTVLFEQDENMVRYRMEGLALPIQIGETLRQRLGQEWRQTGKYASSAELENQVHSAVSALLPTGECNLDMVARVLSINPRSLQIQLKTKNLSFGKILQKTRHNLACQHLLQTDVDMTTLAMNLGFAEQAAFSRAFKKWSGHSPTDWRKKMLTKDTF